MSSEDVPMVIDEARAFLNELFAQGVPLQQLLNHGTFPDGWPERYLAFVDRVARCYGNSEHLPYEVVAVIYNASVYCTKRYHDWQRLTNGVNDATERMVDQVRWAGDRLVLGRPSRNGNREANAVNRSPAEGELLETPPHTSSSPQNLKTQEKAKAMPAPQVARSTMPKSYGPK